MAPGILSEEGPNGAVGGADHEAKAKEAPVVNGHAEGQNGTLTNGEAKAAAAAAAAADGDLAVKPVTVNGDVTANGVNGEAAAAAQNGEKAEGDTEEKKEAKADADGSAKTDEEKEPEDQTMKCEIKHLDRRYDDKDEQYFSERKVDKDKPKQKDWWRLYAFCLVRDYDSDGDLDGTRMFVNPQPLRELLRDVIGHYPTDPIDVDDVQIQSPYHSLFHYRKKLEAEGAERFKDDEESLGQFNLLMGWIKQHFETEIASHDKCLSGELRAVHYDRLWTLFPPDMVVHTKLLNQHRAFKVINTWYDTSELPGMGLAVNFVDFDGDRLGNRRTQLFIPKYGGTQALSELGVMPLDMHDEADEIRQILLDRGRKFESYIGQHFVEYDGIALKKVECGYARFNVSGRVMIDCKTFHRLEPNDTFTVRELATDEAARKLRAKKKAAGQTDFTCAKGQFDKLSDEDARLTNATVRGYSFTVKQFLEFFADQVAPIQWNTTCFDDLVLDASTKKTVQALVATHSQQRDTFDDIVKGKGQGLVCVLHGPPGVGKTLTAECVAEYVKRPLYMVSSGDLGVSSTDLDAQLTRIMDMTSTWRAVLLIDEADVFLERRSLHDLHRNAMVSVFLRVLEYYAGILFLTTNRVSTFDDAFKSRIHIPIRYTDLSFDSRKQIWRNFCKKVPGGVDIDDFGLELLADHDLNGRQIKNVIKAAEALAAFDKVKLDLKQLQQVTKIQATFEKDLTNLMGVDYTAPGSSKKNADSHAMFL